MSSAFEPIMEDDFNPQSLKLKPCVKCLGDVWWDESPNPIHEDCKAKLAPESTPEGAEGLDLEAVEGALVAAKEWWDGRPHDGRVQPYEKVTAAIETVRRLRAGSVGKGGAA